MLQIPAGLPKDKDPKGRNPKADFLSFVCVNGSAGAVLTLWNICNMNSSGEKIDVVIPCHSKDMGMLGFCLAGCRKNIQGLRNIFLVAEIHDVDVPGVSVINEKSFFEDGFSKEQIEKRWKKEHPQNSCRAGWLFQQLIKLGSCYAIPEISETYLILDADVVFLKRTRFFEDGRILLRPSKEFHRPYYDYYRRLMGEEPNVVHSFISHHMPVKRAVLKSLLDFIEGRCGKKWYEAIMDNIDYSQRSGFSEYEMIGYYVTKHFPDGFRLRNLRNVQSFKWKYLPLLWAGLVDYVTIHNYKKPENNPLTNNLIYRSYLWWIKSKLGDNR
ncbi:MAG: hypothetical protein JW749_00930 [Sedimentisphaerales bacterium]|nr:hypothetical protein [Sedimentisphaerales bacterium]